MTIRIIGTIECIYDARAAIPFNGRAYHAAVESDVRLLRGAGINSDYYICDVGCGLGWHLDFLFALGHRHLCGIDLSSNSLRAFRERSDAVQRGDIMLVHGDFRRWSANGFFDAATSFLSCLGAYSQSGDIRYLQSLRRLVRHGGLILFSCFTREEASQLCGCAQVQYDDRSPVKVESIVSFDNRRSDLVISQSSSTGAHIPNEKIHLYSAQEVVNLAKLARIEVEQVLLPAGGDGGSSTRLTVIGRRAN